MPGDLAPCVKGEGSLVSPYGTISKVKVNNSHNVNILEEVPESGGVTEAGLDEFGEHVLQQSMEAPQATDCHSLEEKKKMDTNMGETEPLVVSGDNNAVTSEICAEAINVTEHTLQPTDVAQLSDQAEGSFQAEETKGNWAEQSVLQDRNRPCSMVPSCYHSRLETARTRAFSLPSMYIR